METNSTFREPNSDFDSILSAQNHRPEDKSKAVYKMKKIEINKIKASERLGEHIDFKDLSPNEVKRVKDKLKAIRKKEKRRIKNRKKKMKEK